MRWLLPAEPSPLSCILESWQPYRFTSRLGWLGVRAASHMNWLTALPGVTPVDAFPFESCDWREIGWRWGEAPVAAIHVGTPGPRRKAVVFLLERETGCCRAVVKVALTDEAAAAVMREADVLRTLEEERYNFAPRLLHADPRRGIATMAFVDGRPAQRQMGAETWRLLRSLLRSEATTSLRTHVEQWERGLGTPELPEFMRKAMDDLQDDTPLPSCWEHGDFTPWNIRQNGDACTLLDWEFAQSNGLPLMDAFHFLHMQDLLFGPRPRRHTLRLIEGAASMGIQSRMVDKLETAYLLRAWLTSTRDENAARTDFVRSTLELPGSEEA